MSGTMSTEARYGELVPLGGPDGTVLAGVDAHTGAAFAFKVLPAPPDRRARARLESELARLAPLAERAPVLAADRLEEIERGRWALRMELCAQSLADLLAAFGPLSAPDTVALGTALAQALAAAHAAGLTHGALTPGNVLFRANGEPVLADFGPAHRDAFPADPSRAADGFTAPETIRDATVDERCDLYGLGALLHLALTGNAPHQGPHQGRPGEQPEDRLLRVLAEPVPPIDREGVPPALTDLIAALLERNPTERPDAATALARLEALDPPLSAAAAPPAPPQAPPAEALPRPEAPLPRGEPLVEFGPGTRRRRPTRAAVLAAAGVVAVLAAVAAAAFVRRDSGLDQAPMPAPPTTTAGATPPQTPTAIQIELTGVVDRGNAVDLTWRSSAPLDFAVIVAEEGKPARAILVQRGTSYRVAVDPVRRYCFEIQGTNGPDIVVTPPRPIRGATCAR